MAQQKRGGSESTWLVARRCLALLRRVQRGPVKREGLLTAVYASEGQEAYGSTDGARLIKRFEADKQRLWQKLGVQVRYDRVVGGYVIRECGQLLEQRPLLDLPDEHLETLAFLTDTFQPDSPRTGSVQALVDTLLSWLAPDRRRIYERSRGIGPEVNLRLRDSEPIAEDVWQTVLEARQAKQEVQFDYFSSQNETGIPRQHHIQPWDLYMTDRGHWQIHGYCLFNDGPNGPWHPNDYINYRVSRIVAGSVQILPRKLPPIRPRGRLRDVIFELSPTIARFGVSHRKELIGEPKVTPLDGGWVRVEGQTHDVFDLARNLLYYGKNCHVLGGRELRQEMQELVKQLAEAYL